MRRLYFMLPNLGTTNTVVDELLLKRIDDHHIVAARQFLHLGLGAPALNAGDAEPWILVAIARDAELKPLAKRLLGVDVDHGDRAVLCLQSQCQVRRQGGFSRAAFLLRHGNNHRCHVRDPHDLGGVFIALPH